jgi:hypothetical protein
VVVEHEQARPVLDGTPETAADTVNPLDTDVQPTVPGVPGVPAAPGRHTTIVTPRPQPAPAVTGRRVVWSPQD